MILISMKLPPLAFVLFLSLKICDSDHVTGRSLREIFTSCGKELCNSRQDCLTDEITGEELTCVCQAGWTGTTCAQPIDECQTLQPCSFPGGYCVDRSPRDGLYACGCDTRFGAWRNGTEFDVHGVTSCEDVNECEEGTDNCATYANCTNTPGSFTCSCEAPFEGDGIVVCKIPEESPAATCKPACNPATSYCDTSLSVPRCRCFSGFFQTNLGTSCVDVNECANSHRNNCHRNANCENTFGSYTCTCKDGYTDSVVGSAGRTCRQIDECIEGGNTCDLATQDCVDLLPPTKFECTDIASTANRLLIEFTPDGNSATENNYNLLRFSSTLDRGLQFIWSGSILEQSFAYIDPEGCYLFRIDDSANDGICCDNGSGDFILTLGGQVVDVYENMQVVDPSAFRSTATAFLGSGCSSAPVMVVDYVADNYPEETSYKVIDFRTNTIVLPPNKPNKQYFVITVFGSKQCAMFYIEDSGNDGICCTSGIGDISVSFQDKEVQLFERGHQTDGTSFKSMAYGLAGEGCPKSRSGLLVLLTMELTNDSRPSETSYQLIDALNDISFWLPRNAASSSAAIDPEGCYYFQITDMGDDGTEDFTLTLENKEWPVFENGEKTDGKSFLSRAVATIGTGCGLVESVPTQQRCENNPNRFDICLDYSPSMPFSTYQLFEAARMRWSEIITSDIDDVQLTKLSFSSTGFPLVPNPNGALTVEQFLPLFCDFVNPTTGELEIPDFAEPIDDLRICVASVPVDGPGGILGGQFNVINRINADGSLGLPLYSTLIVDLDGSDQVQAREDLFLYDNILHEMGHSLGIGSMWGPFGLTEAGNCGNYLGLNVLGKFEESAGCAAGKIVEQNTGNPQIDCGHWDSACFGDEMMTFFQKNRRIFSVFTIAALEDLGYSVDYSKAEPYTEPGLVKCCAKRRQLNANDEVKPTLSPEGVNAIKAFGESIVNRVTATLGELADTLGIDVVGLAGSLEISVLYEENGKVFSVHV